MCMYIVLYVSSSYFLFSIWTILLDRDNFVNSFNNFYSLNWLRQKYAVFLLLRGANK